MNSFAKRFWIIAVAIAVVCGFVACGGGSSTNSIAVSITQSGTTTTVNAGGSAVTLTASVANDSTNAGVTWSLSPATGCGTLSSSGTSATYTPPAASTLNSDCTATVTSSSVTNSAKSASLAFGIKAIAVVLPSGESTTQTTTFGGSNVTLTASVANDASGSATLNWTISGGTVGANRLATSRQQNAIVSSTCGSLSASTGTSVTYTLPSTAGCTATITAATSVNPNVKKTFTITVNQATPTLSVTCTEVTYDGSAHSCTGTATGVGGAAVSGSFAINPASKTAAGSYPVTGTFTSTDTNYVSGGTASGTLKIDTKSTTASVTAANKTYDGATAANVTGCTLSGLVGADTVTCSAASATFANANVGNAKTVTATGISLGGAAAANYALSSTSATTTANITAATPTLALSCPSVTYDGSAHACNGSATGVGGASVSGSWSLSPTSQTNAGSYPVTGTFTSSDSNYISGGQANGTLQIAQAPTTVGVTCGTFAFDGNAHSCSATATGLLGAPVSGSFSWSPAQSEINAGNYAVTANFTSSDPNYHNASGQAALAITQATPTVTVACGGPFVYDGAQHSCTATAKGVAGIDITANGSFSWSPAQSETTVGNYTVNATFNSTNPNYTNTGSGQAGLSITRAPLTASVTAANKTYDGNNSATINGCLLSGVIGSDSVTCSATGPNTFSDANVGTGKTVTANGITLAGASMGNYSLPVTTATTTANISQATPTLRVTCGTFTYDGNPHSCSATATGVGGASVAGSFAWNPAQSETAIGSYPITATFTSSDPNYTSGGTANSTLSIVVNPPASITVVSGSPQSATINAAFANQLVAVVKDSNSNPVSGVAVSTSAPSSGASALISYAGSNNISDANGRVYFSATANSVAGSYSVTASVGGVATPASFALTNNAGAPSTMSVVSGSGQSASLNTAFTNPLVVVVRDSGGNAVPGYNVTFSAPTTGASAILSPSSAATTGSNGQASVNATANLISGAYNVTVSGSGGLSAAFSLTNLAPPLVLPSASPSPLGSGTVGVSYSGSINASGGSGSGYVFTVNGNAVTTDGAPNPVSNGLSVSSVGGNTLNIGGTPTSSGTVSLVVSVKDGANNTAGPVTYSITLSGAGHHVSGVVSYVNCCGNVPGVSLSINTTPVQNIMTDSNGYFTFAGVPDGSYVVTPSLANGYFYPTSANVTVSGQDVNNLNFGVALGYTVTGTVTYGGSKSGVIYISLSNNNGNNYGSATGTSIPYSALATGGNFTIHGVPPGTYTLNAWMDSVGLGAQNGSNPSGSVGSVTVPTGGNVAVTILDPTSNSFGGVTGPKVNMLAPVSNGVVLQFKPVTNNNGIEMPPRYKIQWSTDATFNTGVNTTFVSATGGDQPYILTALNTALTGLTNGASLYFRIRGESRDGSVTTQWTTSPAPVVIGPIAASNPVTVTGSVHYSGTPTGPIYVGCYEQNTNKIYAQSFAGPTFPLAYSVAVPNGSNCFMFAILDNNNNSVPDVGDASNTDSNSQTSLLISGPGPISHDIDLSSANSNVAVTTTHTQAQWQSGGFESYAIDFQLRSGVKLPVSMELLSGPKMMVPVDIANQQDLLQGKAGRFEYWANMGGVRPSVGDTYVLNVVYSDGTSEHVNAVVATVLDAFAQNLTTITTNPATSTTPTFSWSAPANPPAGGYVYQFWISGQNGQIWQVPGNNSNLNGLSNSVTSLVWGVDPNDSNNKPSVTSLTSGAQYNWSLTVQDSNGNSAQSQVEYTPQ